ncbi:MAG TPA: ribosome recycling factor [Planctomycetota bacterium]|nr:ribosome recycling factor [Planctomycetota bacterium]
MTTAPKIQDDTKEVMEKALHHLQEVLRGVRTGRATSALVDNIRVDYYGTPTPINQMAAISIPEPRQIVIKPFDISSLTEISKSIQKSDLGIMPQSDGKVLRLTMPPLSGEQRNKYAAKVKDMAEEARIAMRNGRRDMNKHADADLKSGKLTEDEHRKLHDKIQELLKDYEKKLDSVLDKKVAEIKEV